METPRQRPAYLTRAFMAGKRMKSRKSEGQGGGRMKRNEWRLVKNSWEEGQGPPFIIFAIVFSMSIHPTDHKGRQAPE
jgi:hypothetical protein